MLAPDAPTNLMVTERMEESLFITWTNPTSSGGSPINGFRVTYENERTSTTSQNTFSGNSSTSGYNITGLDAFTNYTISLYVRNLAGMEGDPGWLTTSTLSLSELILSIGSLIPLLKI